MNLRRLALAAGCVTVLASTAHGSTRSVSVSIDDDRPVDSCDDIRIRFGDGDRPRPMVREEERLEGTASSLRADLSSQGHIRVSGWDQARTSILVCKAAGGRSDAAARAVLDGISATLRGDTLSLAGPSDTEWAVYFLVRVPTRATVDLEAENGSIAVADLAGTVHVRTTNGPVSLRDCTGDVDARAQNGPISLQGNEGHATLRAENGPIQVTLTGSRWRGEALDARTQNGPLSLTIPSGYSSGVEVETAGYSPVSCKAEACRTAGKTWDDDSRRITLGGSPTLVRLSTVNGPVAIGGPDYE